MQGISEMKTRRHDHIRTQKRTLLIKIEAKEWKAEKVQALRSYAQKPGVKYYGMV